MFDLLWSAELILFYGMEIARCVELGWHLFVVNRDTN